MNRGILCTVRDSLEGIKKNTLLLLKEQLTILTNKRRLLASYQRCATTVFSHRLLQRMLTNSIPQHVLSFLQQRKEFSFCEFSHSFLYITAPSRAIKLSWTFTDRPDRWLTAMLPKMVLFSDPIYLRKIFMYSHVFSHVNTESPCEGYRN